MVVLDMMHKEENHESGSLNDETSLREERKRTGRYVAAGTAIFLSLLGVYQALIQGTPEYAALFAPVVIMFVYVLWILRASRNQNARLKKLREEALRQQELGELINTEVVIESETPNPEKLSNTPKLEQTTVDKIDKDKTTNISLEKQQNPTGVLTMPTETLEDEEKQFGRSYSIA